MSNFKNNLIGTLKKYRVLYYIYYYCCSALLQFLSLFISSSKNRILFVCRGGKQYNDNIPPVYEELLKDVRFSKWEFVWALRDPKSPDLSSKDRTKVCKIDTPLFYWNALKSRCWVTNVSVQRGLNFKNKNTYYINTWHGVPLKYIGLDNNKGVSFTLASRENFDLLCSMGEYDAKVYETAFEADPKIIKVTGYPRNDALFTSNIEEVKRRVLTYYNIDFSKKIVLYAPTFRDYNKSKLGMFSLDLKLSADLFQQELGDNYVLLVRAHGAILNTNNVIGCIDASKYPSVEDLLLITDILVTDYSGIMFDYSLLERPIICLPYDLEEYTEKRGLYINYEEYLPFDICHTEMELYNTIKHLDYEKACEKSKLLKSKAGLIGLGATKNVVNELYKGLNNRFPNAF